MGDNTGKELRNQWSYTFHSFLEARQLCLSTRIAHPTVGHSHGKCDRRVSIIGASLRREPDLQCPQQTRVGNRMHSHTCTFCISVPFSFRACLCVLRGGRVMDVRGARARSRASGCGYTCQVLEDTFGRRVCGWFCRGGVRVPGRRCGCAGALSQAPLWSTKGLDKP